MKKYGCKNPFQGKEFKEKIKESNLKKYGVENPSQNKDVIKRREETSIKRFGVRCNLQNEEQKEKIKQTCLKKYGTENSIQNKDVKKKAIETCLKRYGVDNPLKNKEIKKKQENTILKRYGVKNISQLDIIKEKKEQLSLLKYGTKSPMQNHEVALKCAKSSRKSIIKYHWNTNEELICYGTWEAKVVDYLNENKINYRWQPKTFTMSTGRTYRPDLYLVDKDLWIEIKGRFLGNAEEKWNEFHKQIHKNSELWNQDKLKEMNIL